MKETFLIIPVVVLLVVGVLITLRSASDPLSPRRGLLGLMGTASAMLIRVAGYGVALMAVQRAVGLPLPVAW